ncbi:MAG: putative zinc-binding protein [Bdellovibrionales bacterium]|nr:putative zinc-binding protein [Bdellovibrionales bacterium]
MEVKSEKKSKQIVYSCSGCSTAAQMANYIAIQLDRRSLIEMSCIAGVGGDVKSLVHVAKSADKILALDGCALKCVEHCLAKHDIKPTEHIVLSDYDVKKLKHQDFDPQQAEEILLQIIPKVENL